MNEELTKQLQGYLESSEVNAVTYPFAWGANNEPCLLVDSSAGGWRYTDVITPSGTTHVLSTLKIEA